MATTKSRKISYFSVLNLIIAVLPTVIQFLESGEPNARIDLIVEEGSQRLRANVSTSDEVGSISKRTKL